MILSDPLVLRLVASFSAGFIIVAVVTSLADLFGEGPAGFIGGIPSTGAVGLLSIGLTQSTSAAVQATTLFPLSFSTSFAFLLFYAIPSRVRFGIRMAAALALWFVTALAVALWAPDDFTLSVAVGLALSLVLLLVRLRVKTANSEKTAARPRWRGVVLRGVLGGIVVDAAALLSIVSGPLVGGVFAAAPAIWSSSLYVTNRSQGLEFSRSLTKTFMRTGIMTVIPYAIAARYLFSYFGIWAGTVLAYAVIAPFAYLAWLLGDSKRLKKGTSA